MHDMILATTVLIASQHLQAIQPAATARRWIAFLGDGDELSYAPSSQYAAGSLLAQPETKLDEAQQRSLRDPEAELWRQRQRQRMPRTPWTTSEHARRGQFAPLIAAPMVPPVPCDSCRMVASV